MAEWLNYEDGTQIVVDDDGSMRWLRKCGPYDVSVLHREDGPALMERAPLGDHSELTDGWGKLYWYREGKVHRADGPAVIGSDGTKQWFCDGKPHRDDGPAVERADGSKEYWLDGEFLDGGGAELERRRPAALLRMIKKKWPLKPG